MTYDDILDKAQQLLTNIGGIAGLQAIIIIIVVFVFLGNLRKQA